MLDQNHELIEYKQEKHVNTLAEAKTSYKELIQFHTITLVNSWHYFLKLPRVRNGTSVGSKEGDM